MATPTHERPANSHDSPNRPVVVGPVETVAARPPIGPIDAAVAALPVFPLARRLTPADQPMIADVLMLSNVRSADYSLFNLLGWQYSRDPQISRFGRHVLIDVEWEGKDHDYLPPLGLPPFGPTIDALVANLRDRGLPTLFSYVPKALADAICAERAPLEVIEQRDDFDYLHLRETLVNLSGRALHAKKNFVNRVNKEIQPTVRTIVNEDRERILRFLDEWYAGYDPNDEDLELERLAVTRLIPLIPAMEGIGIIVEHGERMIGLSIAVPLTADTWVVHIEKAVGDIKGLYQYLNQAMASRIPPSVTYINRESDLGLPGLRRAKMSYLPDRFEEKVTLRY